MKLLLDTNIVLDLLQNRAPYADGAERIVALAEKNEAVECVSASAITDIYYIMNKGMNGRDDARRGIDKLLSVLHIIPVTEEIIRYAYKIDWKDFEDSVQYAAAKFNGVDYIITRNKADYECTDIPVMEPDEFLAKINN